MMDRLVQFLRAAKRVEARVADSLLGDAIGGICAAVVFGGLIVIAGVLQ